MPGFSAESIFNVCTRNRMRIESATQKEADSHGGHRMEGERHDTKRQGEADGERSAEKAMVEGRDGRTKEGRGGRAARTGRERRQRLLAISRHSQRTLATWEGLSLIHI